MNHNCFNDQEMMDDVLSSQKFITTAYNSNAIEASGPAVKSAMMKLLDEEQTLQHDIFVEMQSRGWYQTEAAPQNKIDQTKSKFSSGCKNCSC